MSRLANTGLGRVSLQRCPHCGDPRSTREENPTDGRFRFCYDCNRESRRDWRARLRLWNIEHYFLVTYAIWLGIAALIYWAIR